MYVWKINSRIVRVEQPPSHKHSFTFGLRSYLLDLL